MPSIENTTARFIDNDGNSTAGSLQTTVYDSSDCMKRALLKLGLFWLLAIGSLPIIFAHWVLVPGFFLAGPWMAWRTYRVKQVTNHVQGECPVCKETVLIKLEASDSLPKWSYCPACNVPLQISHPD